MWEIFRPTKKKISLAVDGKWVKRAMTECPRDISCIRIKLGCHITTITENTAVT